LYCRIRNLRRVSNEELMGTTCRTACHTTKQQFSCSQWCKNNSDPSGGITFKTSENKMADSPANLWRLKGTAATEVRSIIIMEAQGSLPQTHANVRHLNDQLTGMSRGILANGRISPFVFTAPASSWNVAHFTTIFFF
jgi:hypothetical protein